MPLPAWHPPFSSFLSFHGVWAAKPLFYWLELVKKPSLSGGTKARFTKGTVFFDPKRCHVKTSQITPNDTFLSFPLHTWLQQSTSTWKALASYQSRTSFNGPFLNGLFSSEFSGGKTAHEGIRGNGPFFRPQRHTQLPLARRQPRGPEAAKLREMQHKW